MKEMAHMDEEERNWFVGVDWASETHQVRLSDAKGRKNGEKTFAHGGAGLADMAEWILSLTKTSADQVFVAIEVPHGPVIESLMERGFRVHSINPKQLDRFRDRFSPAGVKDDSRGHGGIRPRKPDGERTTHGGDLCTGQHGSSAPGRGAQQGGGRR
jgi:hypothetical protein